MVRIPEYEESIAINFEGNWRGVIRILKYAKRRFKVNQYTFVSNPQMIQQLAREATQKRAEGKLACHRRDVSYFITRGVIDFKSSTWNRELFLLLFM